MNRWGDGKYCEDGNKAYCCKATGVHDNECYWTGSGSTCNAGDTTMVRFQPNSEVISNKKK
jgi:chitinase